MGLIPDEELRQSGNLNLAPMVDFLFLVIAVFATLALTRAALYDKEVELVKVKPDTEETLTKTINESSYVVNLSVTGKGQYKWLAEVNEFLLDGINGVRKELAHQQDIGLLPKEVERTKILLHIDKKAPWESVADLFVAVREAGYNIYPVYEIDE